MKSVIKYLSIVCTILFTVYSCGGTANKSSTSPDYGGTAEESAVASDSLYNNFNNVSQSFRISSFNLDNYRYSIVASNPYECADSLVNAMIIPHHLIASPLIASAFKSVQYYDYETVIILAPNHYANGKDIVFSDCLWETYFGNIQNCNEFSDIMYNNSALGAVCNNQAIANDHSGTVILPYIADFFPEANVSIVMLWGNISDNRIDNLAHTIYSYSLRHSTLVIGSVDFSHYLLPEQADKNTNIVKQYILNGSSEYIKSLNSDFLDSAPTVNTFIELNDLLKNRIIYAEQSSAYEQLGISSEAVNYAEGTTTYLVVFSAKTPE